MSEAAIIKKIEELEALLEKITSSTESRSDYSPRFDWPVPPLPSLPGGGGGVGDIGNVLGKLRQVLDELNNLTKKIMELTDPKEWLIEVVKLLDDVVDKIGNEIATITANITRIILGEIDSSVKSNLEMTDSVCTSSSPVTIEASSDLTMSIEDSLKYIVKHTIGLSTEAVGLLTSKAINTGAHNTLVKEVAAHIEGTCNNIYTNILEIFPQFNDSFNEIKEFIDLMHNDNFVDLRAADYELRAKLVSNSLEKLLGVNKEPQDEQESQDENQSEATKILIMELIGILISLLPSNTKIDKDAGNGQKESTDDLAKKILAFCFSPLNAFYLLVREVANARLLTNLLPATFGPGHLHTWLTDGWLEKESPQPSEDVNQREEDREYENQPEEERFRRELVCRLDDYTRGQTKLRVGENESGSADLRNSAQQIGDFVAILLESCFSFIVRPSSLRLQYLDNSIDHMRRLNQSMRGIVPDDYMNWPVFDNFGADTAAFLSRQIRHRLESITGLFARGFWEYTTHNDSIVEGIAKAVGGFFGSLIEGFCLDIFWSVQIHLCYEKDEWVMAGPASYIGPLSEKIYPGSGGADVQLKVFLRWDAVKDQKIELSETGNGKEKSSEELCSEIGNCSDDKEFSVLGEQLEEAQDKLKEIWANLIYGTKIGDMLRDYVAYRNSIELYRPSVPFDLEEKIVSNSRAEYNARRKELDVTINDRKGYMRPLPVVYAEFDGKSMAMSLQKDYDPLTTHTYVCTFEDVYAWEGDRVIIKSNLGNADISVKM